MVQQLNLAQKWAVNGIMPSPKEACALLRGKLTVKQVGDTSVIEISAASPDAAEAVAIANEVARAYKKYVEGIMLAEKQRPAEALANTLKEQEDKAQKAEQHYRELRKKQGLPERPVAVDKDAKRLRLTQLRMLAKCEMLEAQAKLDRLTTLNDEDLVTSFTSYVNDPSIKTFDSEIQDIQKQLQSMAGDPATKQTQAALDELNQRIKTVMREFIKALAADCAEKKSKFEAFDQERAALSGQNENLETKRAGIEWDTQKSIFETLKKRVSEMPPPEEKPPRCTVEIISLANTASD
ncbi:MAG TPA: hypothetical protein PKI68_08430 [Pontiellaceae bacterium]|nr:hypothetical protein [Pontiellaceae bacterium]